MNHGTHHRLKSGKIPTIAEAKAVWDSTPERDRKYAKVARAIIALGFDGFSQSRLYRWHLAGWVEIVAKPRPEPVPKPKSEPEMVEIAKEGVEKAKVAEQQVEVDNAAELAEIAKLDMTALAETATRESLSAQIVLAREIKKRAAHLIKFAPEESARLIKALKDPSSNVTLVLPNDVPAAPRDVTGNGYGHVIEHDAREKPLTMTQQAILEFRNLKKVGAGA